MFCQGSSGGNVVEISLNVFQHSRFISDELCNLYIVSSADMTRDLISTGKWISVSIVYSDYPVLQ